MARCCDDPLDLRGGTRAWSAADRSATGRSVQRGVGTASPRPLGTVMGFFGLKRSELTHADPRVRRRALLALPAGRQQRICEVAEQDSDPELRLLAAQRVEDEALLQRLRTAEDPAVVGCAEEALARRATGILLRCSAERADALLPLVAEANSLTQLALQAREPTVRQLAAERLLADPERYGNALTTVAIQSEEEGVAVRTVAALAKHSLLKEVQRKAKLDPVRRAADEAVARCKEAFARPSPEQCRQARAEALDELCLRLEQIAGSSDPAVPGKVAAIREEREEVLATWSEVALDDRTSALEERFVRALERFEEHRAELARAAERRAAALESCEEVLIEAEAATGPVAGLDARWRVALAELGDDAATEELARRYVRATDPDTAGPEPATAEPTAAAAPTSEAVAAAETLVTEADGLTGAVDLRAAEERFQEMHKELHLLGLPAGHVLLERFYDAYNAFKDHRRRRREQREEEITAALHAYEELAVEAETLAAAEDDGPPQALVRTLKDLDGRWRAVPPVPARRLTRLRARFQEARDVIQARVREGFAERDWERFARIPAAEDLIGRARALLTEEDDAAVFAGIKELQREWKRLGPLPRDKSEELWGRFKAVGDEVFDRLQPFFAERDRQREENLRRKQEILDLLDELVCGTFTGLPGSIAESRDGRRLAEESRRLLDRWQEIGAVPREARDALWERYRRLTGTLRRKRRSLDKEREAEERSNLERKRAVCGEVEGLLAKIELWRANKLPDWDEEAFLARIKELQGDWRGIGHVPRKEMGIIDRFEELCDRVYDQFGDYRERVRREEEENLTAKQALIDEFSEYLEEEHPRWFKEQVGELRRRWREVGRVPRRDHARIRDRWRELSERFDAL